MSKNNVVFSFFDYEDPYKNCDCLPLYTEMNFPKEFNFPWSKVRDMTEKEFEVFSEKMRVFFIEKYEKENTPPHAGYATLEEIISRFRKFNELNVKTENYSFDEEGKKILKGYNSWGNVVDHWFPEMAEVEIVRSLNNKNNLSIMSSFYNKDIYIKKMKRVLWKDALGTWKQNPNFEIWPAMKQGIRIGSGTQPVVNIRTSIAKWLYQTYLSKMKDNELIVYDPSMGWAGRMVSFLAANNHPMLRKRKTVYIGTDPNTKIYNRYKMIEKFWKSFIDSHCNTEIVPVCMGSEEFHNHKIFKEYEGRVSLIYTSPPYFGKEKYCDEETQSYKKFSSYGNWKEGFLKKTLENCYKIMKSRGFLFWNIANLRVSKDKFIHLEKDSIDIAKAIGFIEEDKLYMLMRFTPGRDNDIEKYYEKGLNVVVIEGEYVKYEPIFVFRKP